MDEYSLKKVGDSGDFDYLDQDGVSHNSPNDWLWSFLGGCGCGSSEEIAARARKVFDNFADGVFLYGYGDLLDETLAHWLDSAGLLEHGSSIGGSWLSPKGEKVHKALKETK